MMRRFSKSLQISILDFFLSSTKRTSSLKIISLCSRKISYFLFICVLIDDSPEGDESKEDGFAYTVDLVKLIKSEFGDHFTLGVVGKSELCIEIPIKCFKVERLKGRARLMQWCKLCHC